jgi:hypothetical protein
MSTPPSPSALETMGKRPFSFYPPVVNIEHNEWFFESSTWSEVLVINTKTSQEVWVPRRFLGEVSKVDEPVMIVGLRRELEYKAGSLWPFERRVIELPRAVNDYARHATPEPPGPPPTTMGGMRLEGGTESNIGKLILGALAIGLILTVVIVGVLKRRVDPNDVQFVGIVQQSLGLTGKDDYHSVIRKLGKPAGERERPGQGEMRYRVLDYPDRNIHIIVMGQEGQNARYIGALDDNWKVVDFVDLPGGGGNTRPMLNKIPRF